MIMFLIVFVVAVGILEGKVRARKKHALEKLFELSRTLGCSEYDIFESAGRKWKFSREKVESDFDAYLVNNDLPHYVSQYVTEKFCL
jgi:hypothetical protein